MHVVVGAWVVVDALDGEGLMKDEINDLFFFFFFFKYISCYYYAFHSPLRALACCSLFRR